MPDFEFRGVIPATTTPFNSDFSIDHKFLEEHVKWLCGFGVTGVVPLGSLGEGASLSFDEKCAVLETSRKALTSDVHLVATIASSNTGEAVALTKRAKEIGCAGVMALPPYVYQGRWYETKAHYRAIIEATDLPCMLYNNPHAYGVDVLPEHIVELASECDNLVAVKESSGDARRFAGIRELAGDRLNLFAGLDDIVCEAVASGAVGWIAGLVNALPEETVALFNAARSGDRDRAFEIYCWFLPLLRLDVVPEFVQLIKLVQAEVGMGSETVRPPRLPIPESQRSATLDIIRRHLACRPSKEIISAA